MPRYEVSWQMTGKVILDAADEVEVLAKVDALPETDLVTSSDVEKTQVIATREVQT